MIKLIQLKKERWFIIKCNSFDYEFLNTEWEIMRKNLNFLTQLLEEKKKNTMVKKSSNNQKEKRRRTKI